MHWLHILCVCLTLPISICLFVFVSLRLSIARSILHWFYLLNFVCLFFSNSSSITLSVYLRFCLILFLPVTFSLSVSVSLCPPPSKALSLYQSHAAFITLPRCLSHSFYSASLALYHSLSASITPPLFLCLTLPLTLLRCLSLPKEPLCNSNTLSGLPLCL